MLSRQNRENQWCFAKSGCLAKIAKLRTRGIKYEGMVRNAKINHLTMISSNGNLQRKSREDFYFAQQGKFMAGITVMRGVFSPKGSCVY